MLPDIGGLTSKEAQTNLEKFGPNVLPEKPPPSDIKVFISQLKSPLVYVLIFAGAISLFLGHIADSLIITVAMALNTILGFFQERRAGRALYALKNLITPQAEVIRDGKRQKLKASDVVPGDAVLLFPGAKVPADGKLIFANRLFLDEAILTGESLPVSRKEEEKVFMGTVVSSGQGLMEVNVTGRETKIGGIAFHIQEEYEDTPLRRQMAAFSKQLLLLVIALTLFVFVLGLITGQEIVEIFKTAVALAVSAIPEGLIVSLTVILAIGMQKILKRNGLVRNLASAETLGGVTTICVDKTGTLTEGKMRVVDIVGDRQAIAKQVILANDLDDPIVIAAFEWARNLVGDLREEHPRYDSIPFSSNERFFASLHKWNKKENIIFVNGAPDFLLEWCDVEKTRKKEFYQKIEELTREGKRVVGLAKKIVSVSKRSLLPPKLKSLEFVGLLSFSDPARESVKNALSEAKEAGIKIIVITGDYPKTAEAVLAQIGMPVSQKELILGEKLEKMTAEELSQKVKTIKLFARTTPEQKLKIVEALKKNGEVVAMMGDGVNDAPALNRADIGIVVGEASDVAKELADLVLLDSNFATIVAAVEEGRGIFENIRKIILYLLSDAFGEIVTVIGAIAVGLPLPVTAVQILWINLISDGFPSLALTVDPKRRTLMDEPPRLASEKVVVNWMKFLIAIVSLSSGLVALGFFVFTFKTTGDYVLARSVSFLTLGINSLVYVFSVRILTNPFWKSDLFENKWLVASVFAGFGLQLIPFMNPLLREFFAVKLPPFSYWAVAIFLSILMFIIVEISKFAFSKKLK